MHFRSTEIKTQIVSIGQTFRICSMYIFNTSLHTFEYFIEVFQIIFSYLFHYYFRSTEIKTQMVSIGGSVENVLATFPVTWYPRFK